MLWVVSLGKEIIAKRYETTADDRLIIDIAINLINDRYR
jgi:hypothetical protein